MGKRLYDANGRFVELDSRHAIAREASGDPGKPWVHRFCHEFIASHRTKAEAQRAALQWEMDRVKRMERAAGIA